MTVSPDLAEITAALRESWSYETCDPQDQLEWTPDNPARGQCGVTALVLSDLLGGVLLFAEVFEDGVRTGYHYWNRLPTGEDVDLTREQFRPGETLTDPVEVQPQPPGPIHADAYAILAAGVRDRLGEAGREAGRLTARQAPQPG